MVTIEVLPSQPREDNQQTTLVIPRNSPCKVGDSVTIAALAKACAAVQIQAIWKGVLCRKLKYEVHRTSNLVSVDKVNLEASLVVQKAWRRYRVSKIASTFPSRFAEDKRRFETKNIHVIAKTGSDSINEIEHYCYDDKDKNLETELNKVSISNGDVGEESSSKLCSHRRQVVKLAYYKCSQKLHKVVSLSGFEVLNILQALSVLQPREYEVLSNTMLSTMNEDGGSRKINNNHFDFRLTGSLIEFENDLKTAWKYLVQRTIELSPSSGVFLRKNISSFNMNSSLYVAQSHLLKLCSLNSESLSFLEYHENVRKYSDDTIRRFLSSLGVDIGDINHDNQNTVFDYLNLQLQQTESSFIRIKIRCALEVVYFLMEWERLGERNESMKPQEIKESVVVEKDEIISNLTDEVRQLKLLVHSLESNRCSCCLADESKYLCTRTTLLACAFIHLTTI